MEILTLREERDAFERHLLAESGQVLLTLRGNYPGENKDNAAVSYVVETLSQEVIKKFQVSKTLRTRTKEGEISFFLLKEEGMEAKRKAVSLEEQHPLGRLADLDVRDSKEMYGRRPLGLPERRCFLCPEKAVYCVRSQKHKLEEVRTFFEETVKDYQKKEKKKNHRD